MASTSNSFAQGGDGGGQVGSLLLQSSQYGLWPELFTVKLFPVTGSNTKPLSLSARRQDIRPGQVDRLPLLSGCYP